MAAQDIVAIAGLFLVLVGAVWRMASKIDRLAVVIENVLQPRIDSQERRLDMHAERLGKLEHKLEGNK